MLKLVFISFFIATSCFGELPSGTSYYSGQPKTGTYYSAKDYWKAKRKALKQGNKKFGSAAAYSKEKEEEEDTKQEKKTKTEVTEADNNSSADGNTQAGSSVGPIDSTTDTPAHIPRYKGQSSTMEEFELNSCKRILLRTIGAPYADRGSSYDKGFSPAGLVSYVFSNLGYSITELSPEETWKRTGFFTNDALSQARIGDILFFRLFSQKEGKSKLSLAIFIGDGVMVYPSFTTKKVIKRSCDNVFWKNRYAGSKRVLIGR